MYCSIHENVFAMIVSDDAFLIHNKMNKIIEPWERCEKQEMITFKTLSRVDLMSIPVIFLPWALPVRFPLG